MKTAWLAPVALLAATIAGPAAARAEVIGMDAAACTNREGPAILANIVGLKDRKGRLKLELYPANEDDFLKDDRDLVAQGKTFRRVWVQTPPAGAVDICIRVPHPGRYALFATHDRDGKNKFNFFQDGAGFPGGARLGMSRPKLAQALIEVGNGVATTNIRMQYLRGFGGFGPNKGD
ncbi:MULTISPECIES: DUF2141 domain-containing protein [unclassified Sphingomonas]|jgi:uncharacterized protein (DUF2141 family)|uniref:DUF2141 domain-containing protein n=1 Tax=unclassified Sphingomonas TaxID=196159 RepID=UPI000E10696E|nr:MULTISPECIES: DUF2141 domain-containing protein [unclassified Sphingomonas]AXJ94992.1 hypothetical protein DM480_05205 [Sphingomonas sp. FARSPH]